MTATKSQIDVAQDFGLIGWLEETRLRLPLKGMDCRFDVCGDVASVFIEQVYHNSNQAALNCLYTFPLPGNAAVYRCELQIGERVVLAKVEEREKARALYEEKRRAGLRASLIEVERDNLFTLSLGNVQPEDVIMVRFGYFQTLERLGRQVSLMIPFCPGERYIPGKPLPRESVGKGTLLDTDEVPDASRLSPPRIDAFHPDAATLSLDGTISGTGVLAESVISPMHKIRTEPGEGKLGVTLERECAVPDRDFVLRWEEAAANDAAITAWLDERDGEAFALVRVKAPEQVAKAEDLECDHYFLIDRSDSMEGSKWTKTAEALKSFVRVLNPKDRVSITFFETDFKDFKSHPLLASELLELGAFQRIHRLGTKGGTELLPGLRHVLELIDRHSKGRTADIILITDGQVGNEDTVLKELRNRPELRVHVFGIDTAVNDAFLRKLARQQNGRVVLQTPADDIQSAVTALGARLCRPVLTKLKMSDGWELGEARFADVHEADIVTVALRRSVKGARLVLSGSLPDGKSWQIESTPIKIKNASIRLLWARERIAHLLDVEQTSAAIELSKQFNIVCRETAFVAWDDAEKVPLAGSEIYNPSLEVGADDSSDLCCAILEDVSSNVELPEPARPQTDIFMAKLRARCIPGRYGKEALRLRETLENLPLFKTRGGAEFLNQFEIWVNEDVLGVAEKIEDLKYLIGLLVQKSGDLKLSIELCAFYVRSHIKPKARKEIFLELLRNCEVPSGDEPAKANPTE